MKNRIRTGMITVFMGISLLAVSGTRVAAADASDCGYGERHCRTVEHCFSPAFSVVSLPMWLAGLFIDLCETTYTYYP